MPPLVGGGVGYVDGPGKMPTVGIENRAKSLNILIIS